jgi:hypothetical protein
VLYSFVIELESAIDLIMSEVNESTIETNADGGEPACSTNSSSNAVARVPHADTPAEAVTTTQASHVPMAAAILIEFPSKTSAETLMPTAIAEEEQPNSAIAIPLHEQASSYLVVGDEDALPPAEATALHMEEDEENAPNPLESALPLSSLGTAIMHVEMDGELGVQESHHHDAAVSSRSPNEPRQPFYRRWSKRRWVIAGVFVGLTLALTAVIAVVFDEGDGNTSSFFIFAWSVNDEGLPPISSILLPIATKDQVENLQDCYDHCDEVSDDTGVPYIALASFSDVFLPDYIFDGDDQAACICYRTAPCLEASRREGIVQAAIPAPKNQCNADGNNNPPPSGGGDGGEGGNNDEE